MIDITEEILELFSKNFNDGEPIRNRVDSYDEYSSRSIVEFVEDFVTPYVTQAKKDLLAEVRDLQRYKWMCETLHGGYNANEKDVYAALKRYSEREDLREDFAAFFESAATLTQDTKGGTDDTPRV